MWTILSTVFVASIAGSLHCVGMCGPFAILCASKREGMPGGALGAVAWFNGGRLLMYSVAGVLAGGPRPGAEAEVKPIGEWAGQGEFVHLLPIGVVVFDQGAEGLALALEAEPGGVAAAIAGKPVPELGRDPEDEAIRGIPGVAARWIHIQLDERAVDA